MIGDDGARIDFLAAHECVRDSAARLGISPTMRGWRPAHLDLLAIDEAGQFSLGYTIAVARAARNIMLLGDPQQLGQVSAGSHPSPSTALLRSAGCMEGHDVLPVRVRLLPRADPPRCTRSCAAWIPRLSYDNRLTPHPKTAARSLGRHDPPGVHTVERHPDEGRSTCYARKKRR